MDPPTKSECFASHFTDIFNANFQPSDAFAKDAFINGKIFQPHVLDKPFSLSELSQVLHTLPVKKAAGHDSIPYEFLHCLPSSYLSHLLAIYTTLTGAHTLSHPSGKTLYCCLF